MAGDSFAVSRRWKIKLKQAITPQFRLPISLQFSVYSILSHRICLAVGHFGFVQNLQSRKWIVPSSRGPGAHQVEPGAVGLPVAFLTPSEVSPK